MSFTKSPLLVRAGEVEELALGDDGLRLLLDGDAAEAGSVNLCRSTMGRGQAGPPPHHHRTSPEVFYLLDGALEVLVGDEVTTVRAGDLLVVPPHTAHAFATPAHTGVDMLFLMTGIERAEYFRMVHRVHSGTLDPREFLESQDKYDNHLVESVAWSTFLAGR